ncbi:MAG: hypothetical protein QOH88_915 [Verrucomicrobiota bacterium]
MEPARPRAGGAGSACVPSHGLRAGRIQGEGEKGARRGRQVRISGMKHALIFIALILVIVWVIAKVTITVTSVALHLLWVVAVILAIVWLIGRVKGP